MAADASKTQESLKADLEKTREEVKELLNEGKIYKVCRVLPSSSAY
jgi:hypothetical protein